MQVNSCVLLLIWSRFLFFLEFYQPCNSNIPVVLVNIIFSCQPETILFKFSPYGQLGVAMMEALQALTKGSIRDTTQKYNNKICTWTSQGAEITLLQLYQVARRRLLFYGPIHPSRPRRWKDRWSNQIYKYINNDQGGGRIDGPIKFIRI